MSSTPYDSNLEDGDAEQLVTSEEEEGSSETVNDLPLDRGTDEEEWGEFGEDEYSEEHFYEADEEEGSESETLQFLKEPPTRRMRDGGVSVRMDPEPDGIDIEQLGNLSQNAAAKVAEGVIGVLEEDLHGYVEGIVELIEEDVTDYMERTGTVFPDPLELERLRIGQQKWDSDASFNPCLSERICGEPSTLRMTYDKGVSVFPKLPLTGLSSKRRKNERVQVNLHRVKEKQKQRKPWDKLDGFSQTLEMAFFPSDIALILFKRLYPQDKNVKEPAPLSRKPSQELALLKAGEADPAVDAKRKGFPIVKITNRKQMILPLIDDYYKEEKFWTGSKFKGQYVNRQFFKGKYDHPSGSTLESEFVNGHFHSHKHLGLISYPRGDKFEGEWEEGRHKTGTITFSDGLEYSTSNWKYCEPPDRRYKAERYYGIQPSGRTLYSDQHPAPYIPLGMYDIGEGYYNPKTGEVHRYDGVVYRRATTGERNWIEGNCRKITDAIDEVAPKFSPDRLPGSFCDRRKIPPTKISYHRNARTV